MSATSTSPSKTQKTVKGEMDELHITMPSRWQVEEAVRFTVLMGRTLSRLGENFHTASKAAFHKMKLWTISERIRCFKLRERENVIRVLKTSVRGQRSQFEKDILRHFLVNNMKCVPCNQLANSEMDVLCNEVDYMPTLGKSILFLQGDFGNVYYMVAYGAVSLYFEDNKDKEMQMGRDLGRYRSQQLPADAEITDAILQQMGKHLVTLPQGSGFGEFAILSTTQKLRSASAVAVAGDSVLMILHASTYEHVLKKFHFRQKALSSAIKLLQELPLFNFGGKMSVFPSIRYFYNACCTGFTKLSQLAYVMSSMLRPTNAIVASAGEKIEYVYLVATGSVHVFAGPHGKDTETPKNRSSSGPAVDVDEGETTPRGVGGKRVSVPRLVLCRLGRGQVIGFNEILQQRSLFEHSYISASADCEVYQIKLAPFLAYISSPALQQSRQYKELVSTALQQQQRHQQRVCRVEERLQDMRDGAHVEDQHVLVREQMLTLLPEIIATENPFQVSLCSANRSLVFTDASDNFDSSIDKCVTNRTMKDVGHISCSREGTVSNSWSRRSTAASVNSSQAGLAQCSSIEVGRNNDESRARAALSTAQILLPTKAPRKPTAAEHPSTVSSAAIGGLQMKLSLASVTSSASQQPRRPAEPRPSPGTSQSAATLKKQVQQLKFILEGG
jgi:CRP-like cAMP-binding protein